MTKTKKKKVIIKKKTKTKVIPEKPAVQPVKQVETKQIETKQVDTKPVPPARVRSFRKLNDKQLREVSIVLFRYGVPLGDMQRATNEIESALNS